jgi:hypothetical protein
MTHSDDWGIRPIEMVELPGIEYHYVVHIRMPETFVTLMALQWIRLAVQESPHVRFTSKALGHESIQGEHARLVL